MKTSYLLYKFTTLEGHTYTVMAENLLAAQWNVELAHHVDLAGALYRVIRNNQIVRVGTI